MKKFKILMPMLAIGTIAPTIMSIASCGNSTTITLDKTELTFKMDDDAVTLKATVSDEKATVAWSSDKTTVATVDNGVVTPVGVGEATITAEANGAKATCKVTVTAAEIEIEGSKEQQTSDNKTTTQYKFNVNSLTTNDEETEEIDVEIEDVETTDDVTVEISAVQYDPTTGECYVTITTSKEDGSLNDEETVTFSLNFHCHKHGKEDRWTHKIKKFIIKHSASQIWSGHFDDTDVTKQIKKDKTTEKGVEHTEVLSFPTNSLEEWVESGATEDQYDLSKLSCYVLKQQDYIHKLLGDKITLPDYSTKLTLALDIKEEQQYINVTIPYTITENARFGDKINFTLMFTYDGNTVFQTIGGFSIQYVETTEEPNLELISSREQHYYSAQSTDKETGCNVIAFKLKDTGCVADDFTITSSNERIEFYDKYILSDGDDEILVVGYGIKQGHNSIESKELGDNLFNVAITVKWESGEETWTETFKGFSFYNGSSRYTQGTLISSDLTKLAAIEWTIGQEAMEFNNVFKTCKPFNISNFVYKLAYAQVDGTQALINISQLGYEYQSEYISKATINTKDIAEGNHDVKIYVCIISGQAAYIYTLNVGTVEFKSAE